MAHWDETTSVIDGYSHYSEDIVRKEEEVVDSTLAMNLSCDDSKTPDPKPSNPSRWTTVVATVFACEAPENSLHIADYGTVDRVVHCTCVG